MSFSYSEMNLGKFSKRNLLQNILSATGYQELQENVRIAGLSGLMHNFEIMGIKDKNLLLVVGGAEDKEVYKQYNLKTPKEKMEFWQKEALLSAYDVEAALKQDGYIIDLMFFRNISHHTPPISKEPMEYYKPFDIPDDLSVSWTKSIYDIPILSDDILTDSAQSIGACFLSLNTLSLEELGMLTSNIDEKSINYCKQILNQKRISQYFSPPTDELLLSTFDRLKTSSPFQEATQIIEIAEKLGHKPTPNILINNLLRDPVEIAKELEKKNLISYKGITEVTQEGIKIRHEISKSAQESFVIRLIKALNIGQLTESIVKIFKPMA
ncbi:MAG: hypothetical protein AVO38_15625 [delta proteobacterium ML8_D]|jgi:hypothetical protein|nr:MAG: hypothetical protein AVO38_15625 [delta proteobacterium ML8_D]